MAKRVIFSKKAEIDLIRIIEFNNLRNGSDSYSKKFFIRLNKRLKELIKQPFIGTKKKISGNSSRYNVMNCWFNVILLQSLLSVTHPRISSTLTRYRPSVLSTFLNTTQILIFELTDLPTLRPSGLTL